VPVQNDLYLNRIAEAKDRSVELSDRGERQQAAQLLKGVSAEYKRWAESNALPAAAAEADKLQTQADQIGAGGYDKVSRKAARTESQQTRTQQSAK
jgi:hypothetical protein